MNGLAVGMKEAAIGMAVISILLILAVTAIISTLYVFSEKIGRKSRLKIATKKIAIWGAIFFLIGFLWEYHSDVRVRARAHGCTQELSPHDGGLYRAEQCYLGGGNMLLRVFDARSNRLLAERTYPLVDVPELVWTRKRVFDRFGPEDMSIELPPILLDRLIAKLP